MRKGRRVKRYGRSSYEYKNNQNIVQIQMLLHIDEQGHSQKQNKRNQPAHYKHTETQI